MMRKVWWIGLALLTAGVISMGVFLRAEEGESGGGIDPELVQRIARLVKDLGSDSYEARERATKELIEIGESALKFLDEAIEKSEDPEVRWRAQRAKAAIELKKSKEEIERSREGIERAERDFSEAMKEMRSTIRIGPLGKGATSITVKNADEEYTLRHDEKGVSLAVKEKQEDGSVAETTYEAESIEQFREKYPDVAEKYGVDENRLGKDGNVLVWEFDGEDLLGENPEKVGENLRKNLDDLMEKLLDRDIFEDFDEMFDRKRPWRFRDFFDKEFKEEFDEWFENERENAPDFLKKFRERMEEENVQGDEEALESGEGHTALADCGVESAALVPALRYQLGLESAGALIISVEEGSKAAGWGLARFDIVVAVGGEKVEKVEDLERLLPKALEEGTRDASIEIVRKGEKMTLKQPQ